MYTLTDQVVTTLTANVYVYSLEKWLLHVRQSLLPCYQKLKNVKFTKRLETATKDLYVYKFSFDKKHFVKLSAWKSLYTRKNKPRQNFVVLIYEPRCEKTGFLHM